MRSRVEENTLPAGVPAPLSKKGDLREDTTPTVKYTATPPQRGIERGMTAKQVSYAKSLRQQIMITIKSKHNWSSEDFHQMLDEWGYGDSLRKLNIKELQEVLSLVKNNGYPSSARTSPSADELRDKYGIGRFDKQGDFVWSLIQQIGWSNDRFRKFIGKHFHIVHWNVLTTKQRSGCIVMLKNYLKKNDLATEHTERRVGR